MDLLLLFVLVDVSDLIGLSVVHTQLVLIGASFLSIEYRLWRRHQQAGALRVLGGKPAMVYRNFAEWLVGNPVHVGREGL
jgi:hypothetical protein